MDIYLNGELIYEGLDGRFMYTERARRGPEEGYKVAWDEGTIYNPMLSDKIRFTDPTNGELHIVAHSAEPDPDNFPPNSLWLHLNFADVFVHRSPRTSPAGSSPREHLGRQKSPEADPMGSASLLKIR